MGTRSGRGASPGRPAPRPARTSRAGADTPPRSHPLLGGHLPLDGALARADALGCEAVQLHLSAPRTWRDPLPRADADELRADGRLVAVHAPYLVNPPSADPVVRERSDALLRSTFAAAATVGAQGVVVHAGQAGPTGEIAVAVSRWVAQVASLGPGPGPALWIENTAAGNAAPGRHLDDLVTLVRACREAADGLEVGVCLDTAHGFAGDPACGADPGGWVTALVDALGPVACTHVNDSGVPAGAGSDRHANLGAGHVPLDDLAAMVTASQAPTALLETPGYGDERRRDLRVLAGLLGRPPPVALGA